MKKYAFATIGLIAVFAVAACGPSEPRPGGTMQAPELGISLQAPRGWQVQSTDHGMATKGDGTGIILDEPLHGRAFEEHVEELVNEFGAVVESREEAAIGGHEAVVAVIAYPDAGSKALKAYIHKPPNLIEVSFVTPADDFEAEEAHLRAAINSIQLR